MTTHSRPPRPRSRPTPGRPSRSSASASGRSRTPRSTPPSATLSRSATAASTPRGSTERGRRRPGPRRAPTSRATRSSSPPRSGTTTTATTSTLRAFDASMPSAWAIEVLDLYLIHWPVPAKDAYVDTWRALLELRAQGRIRAVGVCNFQPAHLQRLLDETGELPALNQIELHPRLQQARAARLPRPARHRHRGLEPAGLRRAARRPGHRRDRSAPLPHPGPGHPALAPPAGQRRHPQVRDARRGSPRTSRSSTSRSSRPTSPRSRA